MSSSQLTRNNRNVRTQRSHTYHTSVVVVANIDVATTNINLLLPQKRKLKQVLAEVVVSFQRRAEKERIEPPKGNWPWLTSSFVALESIDLSRRKTWLSPWDAKSSRQIGLTRLYCPHGTTQIIQPRRRLQIYGKVSCNWGNWKSRRRVGSTKKKKLKMKKTPAKSHTAVAGWCFKSLQGCVNFCWAGIE